MPARLAPARQGRSRPGSLDVPHERTGVRLARHTVADQLTAVGVRDEARDDAHARALRAGEQRRQARRAAAERRIAVGWTVLDDALHLEITDGGAVTRPQAGVAALFSGSGRGLDIVRTICRAWGVTEGERLGHRLGRRPHDRPPRRPDGAEPGHGGN